MKIYMLRWKPEPFECAGDPISLHLTRESAEKEMALPEYDNYRNSLTIDEWEVTA